MTENTVIDFARPSDFSPDPLTDVFACRSAGASGDGDTRRGIRVSDKTRAAFG